MEARRPRPSAASLAVLFDSRTTEILAAYAQDGYLHTVQFQEAAGEAPKTERYREVNWERAAPAGAEIVIPETGHTLARLNEFWLLWRNGNTLLAQAVHHRSPVMAVLSAGEQLIDRPLVTASRELHAYACRGAELVRHRYASPGSGKLEVALDRLTEFPIPPGVCACVPLPGDPEGTALIGTATAEGETIRVRMAYVRGSRIAMLDGQPEGRYELVDGHRPALHAGTRSRPAFAVVARDRNNGTYVQLEARFDLSARTCTWNRTNLEQAAPDSLGSSRTFYYKTQDAPEPFVLAVKKSGDLVLLRRRNVQLLRAAVGEDYDYPVLTTLTRRYEAVGTGPGMELMPIGTGQIR